MTDSYIPELKKINQIIKETDDTRLFRINIKNEAQPGQFYQVSILGIGESPISLSSYSKDHIDLTIRNVGTVTKAIFGLKKEEKIGIRGPYGRGYPIEDMKGPIVLVGGGTGVAPIKGVIEYLIEKKREDVKIFLGFRSEKEILYKNEIKKWEKHYQVEIILDKKSKGYKQGVITDLLKKTKISKESHVLICGPPIMIKFVMKMLTISKEQIWLSLERNMRCGIGKCGNCQMGKFYVCKDGPVFNAKELEGVFE